MKILLVAATLSELKPIQEKLDEELDEHEIFSLITGVGMIATTFELTRTLMVERFDLAINAGIAGAFDKRDKTKNKRRILFSCWKIHSLQKI